MSASDTPHSRPSPAEVYEALFVPALMQPWTDRVADAAEIGPGQQVLDVACGTGVLARRLVPRVGPAGKVTGVDSSEGMLAVARRISSAVDWRQAAAEHLPFAEATFEAVVSQFGLMFFANRRATSEMVRVVRPGGRLAVAVWGGLEQCPGYAVLTALVEEGYGHEAAAGLRAPFTLGDPDRLLPLFDDIGLVMVDLATMEGTARFPSVSTMVRAEVEAWGLGEVVDETQVAHLLHQAEQALRRFVAPDGRVSFPMQAHIVTARKG